MKHLILSLLTIVIFYFPISQAKAEAGDYALRPILGLSFNLLDFEDQVRIGGEFNYDLGYNMHISFLSLFGISNRFRFQMMPGFGYNYLYLGPAVFHGLVGAGYGRIGSSSTLDFRFSTGVRLPLNEKIDAYSDVNYFISPVGTPGTPQTFDWLIGLSFKL